MDVRRATPDDVPAIVDLAHRLFVEDSGRRDRHADAGWPASAEGRRHYARLVEDPGGCVLLAAAPTSVGFLTGRRRPAGTLRPGITVAELQAMFVLPGHRSRGIGAALLAAFRTWAATGGADVLSVAASAANTGARRFYERSGFRDHTIVLESTLAAGGRGSGR